MMKRVLIFLRNLILFFFISSLLAVVLYRFVPVYLTPLMVIRLAEQAKAGKTLKLEHEWVPIEKIAQTLPQAVVASEDNLFMEHPGFDFKQIQKAREEAAKERIFSLLPEDQKKELAGLFDEFEAFETKESKYAHAMDNLQPLILNHSNGGEDWKRHGVTKGQVYGRQGKTKLGSNRLFQVVDAILQENIEKGNIKEREEEK